MDRKEELNQQSTVPLHPKLYSSRYVHDANNGGDTTGGQYLKLATVYREQPRYIRGAPRGVGRLRWEWENRGYCGRALADAADRRAQ